MATKTQIVATAYADGAPAQRGVLVDVDHVGHGTVILTLHKGGQRIGVEFDYLAALDLREQLDAILGEF